MNVSCNMYDMHFFLLWWLDGFNRDLFQNEVMPLLHETLQLLVIIVIVRCIHVLQSGTAANIMFCSMKYFSKYDVIKFS